MIGIRPQDLPELRAELAAASSPDSIAGADWIATASGAGGVTGAHIRQVYAFWGTDGETVLAAHRRIVEEADLYFVSAEMSQVAEVAGDGLPAFHFEPEDLPSQSGLIIFDAPGISFTYDTGVMFVGLLWGDFLNAQGQRLQYLLPVYDVEGTSERVAQLAGIQARKPSGVGRIHSAVPGIQPFGSLSDEDGIGPASMFRVIRAAMLLMQQSLAELSEVEPDRAARKRLRRAGREPVAVRVIELRRPKHSLGDLGDASRNYVHRWITRGHWRQQWYATRQVHRPVWIAPHVKGPDGAPMIGGEKVYAWKR